MTHEKTPYRIAVEIVSGWYAEASRNEQHPFTILEQYKMELVRRIAKAIERERVALLSKESE